MHSGPPTLALDRSGRLDEIRQRALTRYYLDAGAGGLAVGVHTTQFEIREAGLLRAVLGLAAETAVQANAEPVMIAGVCGSTSQAVTEASLAADLGYHFALVSMAGLDLGDQALVDHVARVGEVLPVMGFYLQVAVGGRRLGCHFWRSLADVESVVAVKIAAFDRYATLDVVRAVADSDRCEDIALYTGNDDHFLLDLMTTYRVRRSDGQRVEKAIVGSLLGQNAVWTRMAVRLFHRARAVRSAGTIDAELLRLAAELTDANAAVFDVAGGFAGCVAGIHEVLRRQGFLDEVRLLDPRARVSKEQHSEIDRVLLAYPHLHDDEFVAANLRRWLSSDQWGQVEPAAHPVNRRPRLTR